MLMRASGLILLTALLCAQDAPPTIKVDVDVVNILFNVRDKHTGLIGNLTKDDFTIFGMASSRTSSISIARPICL